MCVRSCVCACVCAHVGAILHDFSCVHACARNDKVSRVVNKCRKHRKIEMCVDILEVTQLENSICNVILTPACICTHLANSCEHVVSLCAMCVHACTNTRT